MAPVESKYHATRKDFIFMDRLVAHLVIVVLVLLLVLVLLVILLIVFHVVDGNFGVVNDLAACAATTLDNVALVDGVGVVRVLIFIC